MYRLIKKLSLAAALLSAVFTFSSTTLRAQEIWVVQEGGRTNVTLSDTFLATLSSLKVTPGALYASQLANNNVYFPITGGSISLDSARGQIMHSGGLSFTSGATVVRLDGFILDTLSGLNGKPFVTALVDVDGSFVGRIKVFDVKAIDPMLPIEVKSDGAFSGNVGLYLDPECVSVLNDAFKVTGFSSGQFVGDSFLVAFVSPGAYGH